MIAHGLKTDNQEVIDTIDLVNFCRTFRALPRGGGVEDQDPDTVEKMRIIVNLQNEKDRIDMEKREAAQRRAEARRGG